MNEVLLLVARGLAGGALVAAFSLRAEVLSPKAFSGLFSSVPSVAFASLASPLVLRAWRRHIRSQSAWCSAVSAWWCRALA